MRRGGRSLEQTIVVTGAERLSAVASHFAMMRSISRLKCERGEA